MDENRLETIESIPKLESLQDFSCRGNQVYMLGTSAEIRELLPALMQLDLANNSLYSKLELLCLARVQTFYELDLRGNPCAVYPEYCPLRFEAEMMEEFPHLRTLNGKEIGRLTPAQRELKRLREASDVSLEDEKEVVSARPGSSRGTAAPSRSRPQTTVVKIKPAPTIEEMHRKNFIEDLNTSVLELKQTFKAAMSRIKTTLQSIFAMPGEPRNSTGSLFPTQVKSGMLSVVDELDEDKSALEQSMEAEEEKWFAAELRKTQDSFSSGLQRKLDAFDSNPDLSRSHKVVMKHKYLKLDKPAKAEGSIEAEEPPLPAKASSRHRQNLLRAKEWTAQQGQNQ